MTKKEFKKKSKAEKTQSYRFTVMGDVIVLIGFLIVLAALYLDQQMQLFPYPMQIVGYLFGGIASIVGMVFVIIGEYTFNKSYKEYLNSKQ